MSANTYLLVFADKSLNASALTAYLWMTRSLVFQKLVWE